VSLLGIALASVLVAVTVSDLERLVIPNRVLLAGAIVGLAVIVATDPGTLSGRGVAALGAGGFLLLGAMSRRGGMGMGDVKLAALLGLYLGAAVVPALAVAFAAGVLCGAWLMLRNGTSAREQVLPFGPFLALGGLVGLWAGDGMVDWYLDGVLS
jgi:leader peptidase (prepilin peptidase)/N-methyltransferase